MKLAAILLGKSIHFSSRLLNIGGGQAAPGHYALKLEPNLIPKLIFLASKNIIITGTNGKTTTARLLANFAKAQGLSVIHNSTGSNLERGIASTLISSVSLLSSHISRFDLGIWELDEAAFNIVAPKINPDLIVFLNVSRDQLDRYGEVDSLVKKWCQTLKQLPKSMQLILNSDDYNVSSLDLCFSGQSFKFSVHDQKIMGEKVNKSNSGQKADFLVNQVELKGLTGSRFSLSIGNTKYSILLPLPGLYHIYDFLAAFSAGINLGFEPQKMIDSLTSFSPAFGRVEKITFPHGKWDAKEGYIFLIKNPTGTNQVLNLLSSELKNGDTLLLCLNDNFADGTDVSWIWDVQFEKCTMKNVKCKIICSGTRATDLALRLKYAGISEESIMIEGDLSKALEQSKSSPVGRLFILPTYTALLSLQSRLANLGLKRHYWKD